MPRLDSVGETRIILVQSSPGERRIAVMSGGVLTDYAIWRPGMPDGLGDVHRGRVIARVPALGGSFVSLRGTEAFLPDSACPAPPGAGDGLTVRITRAAQSGKGPRLTMVADTPVQPNADIGLVACGPTPLDRLASAWPDAGILVENQALFAALRPVHGARLRLQRPVFDAALEAEIADLVDPVIALPHGMRASIVPTPALTAIDLDTAGASADRAEKSAAQRDANRAAIPALARQIRLRNLSGAILIDFAGMPAKRRHILAPELVAALAQDPVHPRLLGFTSLGFAEILRPRLSPPLHEILQGAHAAGLRALRHAGERGGTLRAAPGIIASLQADQAALEELAHAAIYPLMLKSDPTLAADSWTIEDRRA